jgi:hypothetical protein
LNLRAARILREEISGTFLVNDVPSQILHVYLPIRLPEQVELVARLKLGAERGALNHRDDIGLPLKD